MYFILKSNLNALNTLHYLYWFYNLLDIPTV
jgi:hypothetical protein